MAGTNGESWFKSWYSIVRRFPLRREESHSCDYHRKRSIGASAGVTVDDSSISIYKCRRGRRECRVVRLGRALRHVATLQHGFRVRFQIIGSALPCHILQYFHRVQTALIKMAQNAFSKQQDEVTLVDRRRFRAWHSLHINPTASERQRASTSLRPTLRAGMAEAIYLGELSPVIIGLLAWFIADGATERRWRLAEPGPASTAVWK